MLYRWKFYFIFLFEFFFFARNSIIYLGLAGTLLFVFSIYLCKLALSSLRALSTFKSRCMLLYKRVVSALKSRCINTHVWNFAYMMCVAGFSEIINHIISWFPLKKALNVLSWAKICIHFTAIGFSFASLRLRKKMRILYGRLMRMSGLVKTWRHHWFACFIFLFLNELWNWLMS